MHPARDSCQDWVAHLDEIAEAGNMALYGLIGGRNALTDFVRDSRNEGMSEKLPVLVRDVDVADSLNLYGLIDQGLQC